MLHVLFALQWRTEARLSRTSCAGVSSVPKTTRVRGTDQPSRPTAPLRRRSTITAHCATGATASAAAPAAGYTLDDYSEYFRNKRLVHFHMDIEHAGEIVGVIEMTTIAIAARPRSSLRRPVIWALFG